MFNILSGEFYKFRKNKAFYICILVAVGLALLLYGSLVMIDKIDQGEMQNGTGGITISEGSEVQAGAENAEESVMVRIGIIGVLQQMFGGHFVGLISAVFASIFVIGEYGNGAVKNIVGKGYSRETVFVSKLVSTVLASTLLSFVTAVLVILLGLPFVGKEGIQATVWKDVAAYTGMQLVFGIAITGMIVLIGELTRSLAAGIAVSIGVLMFSTTLTAGLDLVCHNLNFQPSKYWVLDLLTGCPVSDLGREFVVRGIGVSLVWFLIAAVCGTLHFKKADVK